LHNQADFVNIN